MRTRKVLIPEFGATFHFPPAVPKQEVEFFRQAVESGELQRRVMAELEVINPPLFEKLREISQARRTA